MILLVGGIVGKRSARKWMLLEHMPTTFQCVYEKYWLHIRLTVTWKTVKNIIYKPEIQILDKTFTAGISIVVKTVSFELRWLGFKHWPPNSCYLWTSFPFSSVRWIWWEYYLLLKAIVKDEVRSWIEVSGILKMLNSRFWRC